MMSERFHDCFFVIPTENILIRRIYEFQLDYREVVYQIWGGFHNKSFLVTGVLSSRLHLEDGRDSERIAMHVSEI